MFIGGPRRCSSAMTAPLVAPSPSWATASSSPPSSSSSWAASAVWKARLLAAVLYAFVHLPLRPAWPMASSPTSIGLLLTLAVLVVKPQGLLECANVPEKTPSDRRHRRHPDLAACSSRPHMSSASRSRNCSCCSPSTCSSWRAIGLQTLTGEWSLAHVVMMMGSGAYASAVCQELWLSGAAGDDRRRHRRQAGRSTDELSAVFA